MMFYEFRQNNSYGMFDGAGCVYVEANNADEANKIAQENGIYFNGCDNDIDCSCCGDRWHEVGDYDGKDMTEIDFMGVAHDRHSPNTSPVVKVVFNSGDTREFYNTEK